MKTTKMLLLIALFALGALAQNTVTYTAPVGAVSYTHAALYHEFLYKYLVEDSTPPYPNPLQPGFFVPAYPNHSLLSVEQGIGASAGGFVSPDGLYKANLQTNWFRINGNQEAVELDNIVWTVPTVYPAEGESVTFSMDAQVISVCAAICGQASGTFHLEGQFAFHWESTITQGCRTCGKWDNISKGWVNTSPVVVTINDQSTVAILDCLFRIRPYRAGQWTRTWYWIKQL